MVVDDPLFTCPACYGTGIMEEYDDEECDECNGTGEVTGRRYLQLSDETNLDVDIPF